MNFGYVPTVPRELAAQSFMERLYQMAYDNPGVEFEARAPGVVVTARANRISFVYWKVDNKPMHKLAVFRLLREIPNLEDFL